MRLFLWFIVIAIIFLSSTHVLAEQPYDPSPRAKKVIRTLDSLGMDTPEIREFVSYVDVGVKNKYVAFSEHSFAGGTLKTGYNLVHGFHPADAEIRFTPKDSHMAYTASRKGALASYQLLF